MIKQELQDLYISLLDTLYERREKIKKENLTLFLTSVGKNYKKDDKNSILIVGKSVNGWNYNFNKNNREDIDKLKKKIIQEKKLTLDKLDDFDNLQWVMDLWGNRENYNTKKSAFWRVSLKLAKELFKEEENPIHKIAWSNLYKISNQSGGNPDQNLVNVEYELCKKILFKEIEFLQPKIIIFFTSGWEEYFLKDLNIEKINTDKEYVRYISHYKNSLIIVGDHPQGKKESVYLENIKNLYETNKLK